MNIERTLPSRKKAGKKRFKSVRTLEYNGYFNSEFSYSKNGFNVEFSVLIFDIVCALSGTITFQNAIWAVEIMKNYEEPR